MRKLILDKLELKHNITTIKDRMAGADIYAVLSANACGAGLVPFAQILRDEGISRFAISEPEEAATLRQAGFVEEEILLLRAISDRKELERLADLNVVYTVSNYDTGVALNALAETRSTVLEAHIRLDVGLGSGGFLPEDTEKVISLYHYLPNIAFSGIYTQLRGDRLNGIPQERQISIFRQTLHRIHEAGYETGTIHIADFCAGDAVPVAVRVGRAFLGWGLEGRQAGLHRVGYGEVPLEEPRWLPQGSIVGETKPLALRKPTRVATIPVGYENGIGVTVPRQEGFWDRVFDRSWMPVFQVDGQSVKPLGGIGAREIVLDVTKIQCGTGDKVTFPLDPLFAQGMHAEYR